MENMGEMNQPLESAGPDLVTDCLIVGSGPAGGSLACFLAFNGTVDPGTELVMFVVDEMQESKVS